MKIFGNKKISKTSYMHFFKLIFRSLMFMLALIVYITDKLKYTDNMLHGIEHNIYIMSFIFAVFSIEMTLRFFPSSIESPGCQKQFEAGYKASGNGEKPKLTPGINVFAAFAAWIALNAIFAALYYAGIVDQGFMILLCLAYSVCDMICILFFCPFHTWILKNKCCTTCRIYNWDFIMMFTPCIFIDHILAKLLFVMALALLVQWELAFRRHPERFAENTNAMLQCQNCTEKLCSHKKQLQHYLVGFRKQLAKQHRNDI